MKMNHKTLGEAVQAYSAWIGSDPLLVQGAGGNASWKEKNVLWVKASGTWLKDALDQEIFVPVDLADLQSSIRENDFSHIPKVVGESTLRPSIETLLHGCMPQKVVLHLHAIEVLSMMVRSNYVSILSERLADYGYRWAAVGYQKPGADLAKEVALTIKDDPSLEIILMANHGVVIGGRSVDDVDQKLRALCAALATDPIGRISCKQEIASASLGGGYFRVNDEGIEQLAIDARLFDRLEQDWALYPDHVVFLGARPCLMHDKHAEIFDISKSENSLEIIFCKNLGVFSRGKLSAAKLAQLRCYYDVLARQKLGQELAVLSHQAVASLLDWDAEAYRQSISK